MAGQYRRTRFPIDEEKFRYAKEVEKSVKCECNPQAFGGRHSIFCGKMQVYFWMAYGETREYDDRLAEMLKGCG